MNRKWKVAVGIGAAALVAGGVVGVAGFANAENTAKAATFVDGFGKVTDDFGDHYREVGTLCDGCGNSQGTDLVMLWQAILVADGYMPGTEMDGYFGPTTAKATKEWKIDHKLDANGKVGNATWSRADDNLTDFPEYGVVSYNGADDELGGGVTFTRGDTKGEYDLTEVGAYDDAPWNDVSGSKNIYMSKLSMSLEEDEV